MKLLEQAQQGIGLVQDEWASSLLGQWRNILRSVTASGLKKAPPDVSVYLVDRPSINAFAAPTDDGYAIVLYDGLRTAIANLFSTLLADPRAFPAIGNAFAETPAGEPKKVYGSLTKRLSGEIRSPVDPLRAEFARHLSELSLRFAFSHELFHVLLGHLDLDGTGAALFELGHGSESAKRRHPIELHADEVAFESCFGWILRSFDGDEDVDPMKAYKASLDAQLLDFFAATYCLFQIFAAIDSKSHPSPVHRQARLGLILNFLVKEKNRSLEHPATGIVGTVLNNVDLYMEDIMGIDWSSRRAATKRILITDVATIMAPYSEEVRALIRELCPHSYF